jgi:hypothetical protein
MRARLLRRLQRQPYETEEVEKILVSAFYVARPAMVRVHDVVEKSEQGVPGVIPYRRRTKMM